MRSIVLALLSIITVAFSFGASAQQEREVVIRMHDQVYNGQSRIPLKRLIQRQHPRMNLDNWKVSTVRLVAKSRAGRGRASLVIGSWQSFEERIDGHQNDWNWNNRRSFDRDMFYSRARRRDNNGRWQIQMRGNVKVRRIKVVLERKRHRNPAPRPRVRHDDDDDFGRALVGAAAGLIIGEIIKDLND